MSDPVPGLSPRLLRTLLVTAAVCAGLVVTACCLWGCGSSNRVEGGTASLSRTDLILAPQSITTTTVGTDGTVVVRKTDTAIPSSLTNQTATASGAKQEIRGDKGELKVSGDTPKVSLPEGGTAEGGAFSSASKWSASNNLWAWVFIIGGVLCLGGCLYCLSTKPLPSVRGAVTCGLGLAGCVAAIWLGPLVIVGIAAVGLGLYLYSERDRLFADTALKGVMRAVKESGSVEAVKAEMPKQLDEKYLAFVDRVRRANGM